MTKIVQSELFLRASSCSLGHSLSLSVLYPAPRPPLASSLAPLLLEATNGPYMVSVPFWGHMQGPNMSDTQGPSRRVPASLGGSRRPQRYWGVSAGTKDAAGSSHAATTALVSSPVSSGAAKSKWGRSGPGSEKLWIAAMTLPMTAMPDANNNVYIYIYIYVYMYIYIYISLLFKFRILILQSKLWNSKQRKNRCFL